MMLHEHESSFWEQTTIAIVKDSTYKIQLGTNIATFQLKCVHEIRMCVCEPDL